MIKINENITLRYIPMENLKTTAVGVYIYRPLTKEDASKNALLPYVLQRGCRELPSLLEISKRLEDLYGASFNVSVMKYGSVQIMAFTGKTISDKYLPEGETPEKSLTDSLTELIMSCIFDPFTENGAFCAEFVRQEKKNLTDAILNLVNDKRDYANRRCMEEMCAGDSCAVSKYGTVGDAERLDEKNLYEYYKSIITSSVIDIFISGTADIQSTADTVRAFADRLSFTAAETPQNDMFVKPETDVREVRENMDVTQGKLCIGFTTGITNRDSRYWALMAANSVLGGGAHSKLFNNVREKLSLAYYVSSRIDKNKGLMFISAGIEFSNYEKALQEIYAQLDDVKNGKISEDEFNASVLSLINSLDSYYDDQMYMQMFAVSNRVTGVDYDIEYMKERLRSVTVADAAEAARSVRADTVYFLEGVQE